ncbi:hypothetical protein [Streptomyces sp. JH34]|uniref:hypothetical protein n=1 Tax=Streptomyces sp. JH34 TaxID=2793633 RepID=UPI0023F9586E|nr:hypothetical protein [Streptomyces sp. JH34]MDF6020418.1 hypothetical protein [Streptomyces sp. JH34]
MVTMTIKVYEVHRDGRIQVVHEEGVVVPLAQPALSSVLPDCACPRCEHTSPEAQLP